MRLTLVIHLQMTKQLNIFLSAVYYYEDSKYILNDYFITKALYGICDNPFFHINDFNITLLRFC
jgi:hypothetical protein